MLLDIRWKRPSADYLHDVRRQVVHTEVRILHLGPWPADPEVGATVRSVGPEVALHVLRTRGAGVEIRRLTQVHVELFNGPLQCRLVIVVVSGVGEVDDQARLVRSNNSSVTGVSGNAGFRTSNGYSPTSMLRSTNPSSTSCNTAMATKTFSIDPIM